MPRELFIETSTVKSHLTLAVTGVGARDRLQTVVRAYRNGIAQVDHEPARLTSPHPVGPGA